MLDFVSRRLNSLGALADRAPHVPAAALDVLPDAAKLSFRGRSMAVSAVGEAFGVALPRTACRFNVESGRSAFWLGPDEWLLHAPGEEASGLVSVLEKAMTSHSYSLVDVSHRSDSLALSGPSSAYILNHGCPLDLSPEAFPVGMCTRTILGKATIMLSRPQAQTFHVDVWRSFAPYVWQLLDDARREIA